MKFTEYRKPLNICMVDAGQPADVINMVCNAAADGADGFGYQMSLLPCELRNEETLKSMFRYMGDRPLYVTNYRGHHNKGKSDEELIDGLLFLRRMGADLLDIMGDHYCKDPIGFTWDETAANRQIETIKMLHDTGAEVLMSTHTNRFMSADDVIRMAVEQQRRGADVAKIVTWADNEAEEMENLRIASLLKHELDIPYLFLAGGTHCKALRHFGPFFGCSMWLSVPYYTEQSSKMQPLCRAVTALAGTVNVQPERSFGDQ